MFSPIYGSQCAILLSLATTKILRSTDYFSTFPPKPAKFQARILLTFDAAVAR